MKTLLAYIPKAFLIFILVYFVCLNVFPRVASPLIESSEKEMADTDIKFITYSVAYHAKAIEVLADDWSYWDDAYTFVKDLNQKFISSNMENETLRNAQVNMVIFFDTKGDVIYKKTLSLEKGQLVEIPADIYKENKDNVIYKDVLNVTNNNKGESKTILTDHGLLLYSIFPILKSNGEGPVAGSIMLGRYYNSNDEVEIKETTRLKFETRNYINSDETIQKKLAKSGQFFEFDEKEITEYKLVKDSFGAPSLYIVFKHPRLTYTTFEKVLPYLAMFAAIMAVFSDLTIGRIGSLTKFIKSL